MKIAFTSDLHVEYHLEVAGLVAERAAELGPDVLILGGDVCPDPRRLEAALRVIQRRLRCPVAFLPGNHELWCGGRHGRGANSRQRYHDLLPTVTRRAGAHYLGLEPLLIGDVALVAVTGWYDYSLRDPDLDGTIDEATYRAKTFRRTRTMDGKEIFWPDDDGQPLDDHAITAHMLGLLGAQLGAVGSVETVVVVTHMLPCRDLVVDDYGARPADVELRYRDAFMGTTRLGETALSHPQVRHLLAGHLHRQRARVIRGPHRSVTAETSPIGYPTELETDLPSHVRARLNLVTFHE